MYNGIGLTTPRGSGTNGHIQSNKFFVRPKNNTGKDVGSHEPGAGLPRKPNRDILEHDRKRQIELKLVVLEDKLSDQGYTDSEIAEKIAVARKNLEVTAALEASREAGEFTPLSVSDIKVSDTQTHQVAARKEKQMESLRAAFGIVPDVPLKNDEPKLNSEDVIDDDKISDGSDIDLNNNVTLYKKDPKNRNSDITKAAKVKKNESGRDVNELKIHENQQAKEVGELTDSSDSESDSDKRRKNLSKGNKKGRRHDGDYSDSDDEIHVKENRKLRGNRSRRLENDEVDSDDEDYERHEKMSRKHAGNVKSETERYDDRYDKKSRRHDNGDKLEKTSKRSDKESKEREYVVSKDNEVKYGKVHEVEKVSSSDRWNSNDDKDNRRDGAGNNIDTAKTRKLTTNNENMSRKKRHDSDDDDNTMKIEKSRKSRKYYSNDDDSSSGRSDRDAEDDRRRKEEREKSRSDRGGYISREGRNASAVIEGNAIKKVDVMEDTLRKVEDLYRSKRDTTEDGREMMRGKRKLEDESPDEQPVAKSRSRSTRNELNENQQTGLEENKRSSRSKDDTDQLRGDYSREKKSVVANMDKPVRKISGDEKLLKEMDRKIDFDHKKEERDRREIRSSDIERREERDHRERKRSDLDRREERDHRERRSDLDLKEEQDHREKRSDLDRKEERAKRDHRERRSDLDLKEEQDHREKRSDLDRKEEREKRECRERRSDLDLKEEQDHREKRSDLDRKEERDSRRYGRNDDKDHGRIRHRKDGERDNVEGEHGRSRRREREEEDNTKGRDEKTKHVDSSKRVKYDDFRSEEKKRYYDDDKQDSRDDVHAKRRV